MKINDTIWGALFLILGIVVLADVRTYPKIPGQNIGPDAFPGLLAVLLIGCAIVLIVKGLSARPRAPWLEPGAWLKAPQQVRNFALTVAALVFYVLAAEKIGFLICGSVILAALFGSLRVRPALIAPIAVVATAVIHLIFYKGLRVPLPWGLLPVLY